MFVVYLITCKVCGIQYVGSTITKFRVRLNNYKCKHRKFRENDHHRKDKIEQRIFHQHFCEDGHTGEEDWVVQLIDQADTLPSLRKKEMFWQTKLNTFYPNGLNEKPVCVELD